MNIISEIRNDHVLILRAIGLLEKTASRQISMREKGLEKLRNLLSAHIHAEQEAFYRILLKNDEIRGEILEAHEEHHLVTVLITEMMELEVEDERWEAKLEVLRETFEHHIKEEETKLFPFARNIIPEEKILGEMGLYFRTVSREYSNTFRHVA